jgi:hypothetical protein
MMASPRTAPERRIIHSAMLVPVLLAGEHAVSGTDDLDRTAAPLAQPNPLGDPDGLAVRVRVPRRSRARGEVHAARGQSREERAGEPLVPRWLGRLLAGEMATVMMTEVRGASNAKARRELGWKPRYASWRQGFAQGLG